MFKVINESGALLVHKEIYKDVHIKIYLKTAGNYFYKLRFPGERTFAQTEGYEYDFKKQAINAAKNYIDTALEVNNSLSESKKLNEELSSDKEAFLILDKLSDDLKKIYDQDNFKIYEEERLNKAISDLIELEIEFPLIKELIHFVSQSTYERRYDSQELLDKIGQVKIKYNNLNKNKSESINIKLISEGIVDDMKEKLKQLKDEHGLLSYDRTATFHYAPDELTIEYSDIDDECNDIPEEELIKRVDHDVDVLEQLNATILEVNKENGLYSITILA